MAKGSGEERAKRARRKLNGMAETAGMRNAPGEERLMGTKTLLDAALRAWETRNSNPDHRSV